jgi:glycosyltransferase involved in cell wall biosynthesis
LIFQIIFLWAFVLKIIYLALDKRLSLKTDSGGNAHGGSTHVFSVINAWKGMGHDVKLITSDSDNPSIKSEPDSEHFNIKSVLKRIIPGKIWLLIRDIFDVLYSRKKYFHLLPIIRDFKPDLIYERNSYLCSAGYKVAVETSTPYFLEINSPLYEERKDSFGAPLGFIHQRIENKQVNFANGIVFVSSAMKNYYAKKGMPDNKLFFSSNGVNPEDFIGCEDKAEQIKLSLGIDNKCIVGFVGSIAKYHGIEYLIDNVKSVYNEKPNVFFWIIGPCSNIQDLNLLAEKSGVSQIIKFEGEVKREDIPFYMSSFDIALMPSSNWYGSPIKLFEYAAARIPVIAPKTPAVLDVFTNEDCILLNKDESLADAILKLISDPELAERLAGNMHKKVISGHTWKIVSTNIIRFIEKRLVQ